MNCKELGYKVGDKFKVIKGTSHAFGTGVIIELITDDGSEMPRFKDDCGKERWVFLPSVEKISDNKTLLEILVDELPKRGGWPEGAVLFTQDPDLQVMAASCEIYKAKWENSRWFLDASRLSLSSFYAPSMASDYKTAIVTRDQYESALADKNEGWIKWEGGECPVERGTLVDVKCRDGSFGTNLYAGMYDFGENSSGTATAHDWSNDGVSGDIIAYRLSKQEEADQEDLVEAGDGEEAPYVNVESLTDAIIDYGCEANLAYPLAKHLLASGLIK